MYSNFLNQQSDPFTDFCISTISLLSDRVLKTLKNEFIEDSKFAVNLTKTYQKFLELEENRLKIVKICEAIGGLVDFCSKKFTVRRGSNYRNSIRKATPDSNFSARTPNLSKLERIIEESPKLVRSSKKALRKIGNHKRENSSHIYYESMMSKYLKTTLKTPVNSKASNFSTVNQVQLTDGMFFRLF